ncbi:MAG TPA: CheR family methyltransferase [Thermoanaerobaculia bacterium]|nr:CheR family methyltransferase [Thermoanaerobaculia bacterium]
MTEPAGLAPRFATLIREATGNVVAPERFAFLVEVATRRAAATRAGDAEAYLAALAEDRLAGEWPVLIGLVTIKESYFYRAPQQLDALANTVLPELLRARAAERRLRIWSAACARGEEPGTLALLLAGHPGLAGWDWSILATDLDEEALAGAERGLYGERAVAQVPKALLARWFAPRGKLFELAPELRRRIDYRRLNLARPPYELPEREFDLILLRNVLIYFRRPLQRRVANQVGRRLAPGGYLFLGASETLWQIRADLEPVDLGPCFCYRPHAPGAPAPPPAAVPRLPAARAASRSEAARPAPIAPVPPPARPPRRDSIPIPPPAAAPASPASPPPDPTPAARAGEPAAEALLRAAALLAANRIEDAARGIDEAVAADPTNPAGHALRGFLDDLSGSTERATAAYRAALYLDAELYQARLLLADCLLRLGQGKRAEHLFREVLAALVAGRGRDLALPLDLNLPDREQALRRCRQALGG